MMKNFIGLIVVVSLLVLGLLYRSRTTTIRERKEVSAIYMTGSGLELILKDDASFHLKTAFEHDLEGEYQLDFGLDHRYGTLYLKDGRNLFMTFGKTCIGIHLEAIYGKRAGYEEFCRVKKD